jgi:hypothetical protein
MIRPVIVDLIRRFAKENPRWGYDRIQATLANPGDHISDQTVGNTLEQRGIEPAPDRKRQTTWKTFLTSHWDVLAARLPRHAPSVGHPAEHRPGARHTSPTEVPDKQKSQTEVPDTQASRRFRGSRPGASGPACGSARKENAALL